VSPIQQELEATLFPASAVFHLSPDRRCDWEDAYRVRQLGQVPEQQQALVLVAAVAAAAVAAQVPRQAVAQVPRLLTALVPSDQT